MKNRIILIVAFVLTGCITEPGLDVRGTKYYIKCIGGVNYFVSYSIPAPPTVKYNVDGTISTCD